MTTIEVNFFREEAERIEKYLGLNHLGDSVEVLSKLSFKKQSANGRRKIVLEFDIEEGQELVKKSYEENTPIDDRYNVRIDFLQGKQTHRYEVYLMDKLTGISGTVSSWDHREQAVAHIENILIPEIRGDK